MQTPQCLCYTTDSCLFSLKCMYFPNKTLSFHYWICYSLNTEHMRIDSTSEAYTLGLDKMNNVKKMILVYLFIFV